MSANIVYAILVTSLATFLSRFLGAVSSEGIKETSKLFKWFNCLAYATLAALIARTIIFPVGVLADASYLSRFVVIILSLSLTPVCSFDQFSILKVVEHEFNRLLRAGF